MSKNLLRRLGDFWKNKAGVAASEFALIAPVMLILFAGTVEASQFLSAYRKVIGATQAAADLVAQDTDISDADLTNLLTAVDWMLQPYSAAGIVIDIASIQYDGSTGSPTLLWRETRGAVAADPAPLLANAQNLGLPTEGLVVVSLTYRYTPLMGELILKPVTFTEEAYLRPRRSLTVTRNGA